MAKSRQLTLLFLLIIQCAFAQTFTSVRDWPMPPGKDYGLVRPGFKVVPKFILEGFGNEKHIILNMDVTMSTPQNPVAPIFIQVSISR